MTEDKTRASFIIMALMLTSGCWWQPPPYDAFDPKAPMAPGDDINRHSCESKDVKNLLFCYKTLASVDCYRTRLGPHDEDRLVGCINIQPYRGPIPCEVPESVMAKVANFSKEKLGVTIPPTQSQGVTEKKVEDKKLETTGEVKVIVPLPSAEAVSAVTEEPQSILPPALKAMDDNKINQSFE